MQTILILRHGEKPRPGGHKGVDESGRQDERSLSPLGWQRAGAWAELFVPASGAEPMLPRPDRIVASGAHSRRCVQTMDPLARKLALPIDAARTKGEETDLAEAINDLAGVTLVCWQHEKIARIAKSLSPAPTGVPEIWPDERFNVVFRLRRDGEVESWLFDQIAPVMLAGDSAETL